MIIEEMRNNFNYRLYGRSKGRGKNTKIIKEAQQIYFKNINKNKYNIIDVGPGYGESTIDIAKNDFTKHVIACEKYIDGINNIAKDNFKNSLKNISIFHGNVHQLLDECCLIESISEMWILFPDPWPKKKHNKRRLINVTLFNKLNKFLKKNAIIHIASDSKPYISEILSCVYELKNNYLWLNQNKAYWDYANLKLPNTKYFQKALKNGLNPFYLKLIKL